MKSLNLRSFVAILFIAATSLVSCKKESVPPPVPAIVGTWEGKYGDEQDVPSNFYSFIIHADGTLLVSADQQNEPGGSGTWTLNGNTFKAVYHYQALPDDKFNVAATVNIAEGKMTGNWGLGETVPDYGTFYMNKK